jgi:hypothetical protein
MARAPTQGGKEPGLESRSFPVQENCPRLANIGRSWGTPDVAEIESEVGHQPGGALGKACQYTLGLWPKLTRFLNHPELELSNNLAENSMRPVAVGRKNWIHVGSPQVM